MLQFPVSGKAHIKIVHLDAEDFEFITIVGLYRTVHLVAMVHFIGAKKKVIHSWPIRKNLLVSSAEIFGYRWSSGLYWRESKLTLYASIAIQKNNKKQQNQTSESAVRHLNFSRASSLSAQLNAENQLDGIHLPFPWGMEERGNKKDRGNRIVQRKYQ